MPSTIRESPTLKAQNRSAANTGGVKQTQRDRNRKSGDSVARRERETVRGEKLGPTVRLDLARPLPGHDSLERFEDHDSGGCGETRSEQRGVAVGTPRGEDDDSAKHPQPSVSTASGHHH